MINKWLIWKQLKKLSRLTHVTDHVSSQNTQIIQKFHLDIAFIRPKMFQRCPNYYKCNIWVSQCCVYPRLVTVHHVSYWVTMMQCYLSTPFIFEPMFVPRRNNHYFHFITTWTILSSKVQNLTSTFIVTFSVIGGGDKESWITQNASEARYYASNLWRKQMIRYQELNVSHTSRLETCPVLGTRVSDYSYL